MGIARTQFKRSWKTQTQNLTVRGRRSRNFSSESNIQHMHLITKNKPRIEQLEHIPKRFEICLI